MKMTERAAFRMEVAVVEIVTNIIEHGQTNDDHANIDVNIEQSAGKVTVCVTDEGIAFNPLEAPERVLPDSLATAPIGGLGIHLARHMSDECAYARCDNANAFTMVFLEN